MCITFDLALEHLLMGNIRRNARVGGSLPTFIKRTRVVLLTNIKPVYGIL